MASTTQDALGSMKRPDCFVVVSVVVIAYRSEALRAKNDDGDDDDDDDDDHE